MNRIIIMIPILGQFQSKINMDIKPVKIRQYHKFIKGYLYSLNEFPKGNVKLQRFGPDQNDNFNNGIFKGLFESKNKK